MNSNQTPAMTHATKYDKHADLPQRELDRSPGPIKNRTSQALRTAISDELQEMSKLEVSPSNLAQLSRFANVAQELLMVRDPIAEVRARKRPRLSEMAAPWPGATTIGAGAPSPECDYSGNQSLTGEAAMNETFGAKLIRELIPALSNLTHKEEKDDVEKLVAAIRAARDAGLDDTADNLEEALKEKLKSQYLKSAKEEIDANKVVDIEAVNHDHTECEGDHP